MNKVPVEKNKEYIVDIIDSGFEGEGIAKIDNFTIFIPGAIKGEKLKILIVKVLSSHAFGKILEYIKASDSRIDVDCSTYKRCGGCNLRHVNYETTLIMKQNAVQSLVNKTLKNKISVSNVIGMDKPYHYRNKAQYPIGLDKSGNVVTGIFAERTHEIIPMHECFIQNKISQDIAKKVVDFIKVNNISVYDEKTGKGLFRHVVIRVGVKSNQVMCILVINGKKIPKENELVDFLLAEFPNITTIVKNFNLKNTNVILGYENESIYGSGFIEDKLGDYTFKISPLSFYQINPIQTEILYNTAINMAGLQGNETAVDLYCGIGTISLFLSKFVKSVYGIEIVPEAIEDAKQNAEINFVSNAEFIVGDVEFAFDDLLNKRNVVPDVVFVDPPRKGLDNNTICNILNVCPKKVVYISCNPASLVRDLAKLEEKYDVCKIQPVDMFPWTSHVECCSVLKLKESTEI